MHLYKNLKLLHWKIEPCLGVFPAFLLLSVVSNFHPSNHVVPFELWQLLSSCLVCIVKREVHWLHQSSKSSIFNLIAIQRLISKSEASFPLSVLHQECPHLALAVSPGKNLGIPATASHRPGNLPSGDMPFPGLSSTKFSSRSSPAASPDWLS